MIRFNLQMGDFIGKINKTKRENLFIYLFIFILFSNHFLPLHTLEEWGTGLSLRYLCRITLL